MAAVPPRVWGASPVSNGTAHGRQYLTSKSKVEAVVEL